VCPSPSFRCACARACLPRPGRDAHSPIAPRVFRVLDVRARPARLSASDRQPVPPVLPDARAPSKCSMPRPPPLRAVVKAARRRAALKLQQLHAAARRCCVVRLLCRCGELTRWHGPVDGQQRHELKANHRFGSPTSPRAVIEAREPLTNELWPSRARCLAWPCCFVPPALAARVAVLVR
jgi:hypothetical protein